jgi:hypothetical protein
MIDKDVNRFIDPYLKSPDNDLIIFLVRIIFHTKSTKN